MNSVKRFKNHVDDKKKSNAEILKEKQDELLKLMDPNNSYVKNESDILRLQREIDGLLSQEQNSNRRLPEGGEEMLAAVEQMAAARDNDEYNVDNSAWQGDCQEMG